MDGVPKFIELSEKLVKMKVCGELVSPRIVCGNGEPEIKIPPCSKKILGKTLLNDGGENLLVGLELKAWCKRPFGKK